LTCPNCGSINPDSNRFCRACGVRLLPEQPTAQAPATVPFLVGFARDAVRALVLPVPFVLPLPLFWRHGEVPRRVRFAVGCVGLLWAVCVTVSVRQWLPAIPSNTSPQELKCRKSLRLISVALRKYERAHGRVPGRFEDLFSSGLLDPRALACPGDRQCQGQRTLPMSEIWPRARPIGGLRGIYYRPQFDPEWSKDTWAGRWLVVCDRIFGGGEGIADERTGEPTACCTGGEPHVLLIRANGKVDSVEQRMTME